MTSRFDNEVLGPQCHRPRAMSADLDCALKLRKVAAKQALHIGDAGCLPTNAEYAIVVPHVLSYDGAIFAIKLNQLVAHKGQHVLRVAAKRGAAATIGNRIPQ